MSAEDISTGIKLDTTEWKTGVSQINKDVRVLQSDFKVVAAGMDDWSKSSEGLTARNETLSNIISKQKEKVTLLSDELQRMTDEAAANGDTTQATSNALQDFHIKVNKAKEELAKSETELKKNQTALEGMEEGTEGAAEGTEELGEKSKETEKAQGKLGDAVKKVASVVSDALAKGLEVATAALAATTAAIAAAVAAGFDMSKGAGEMADNMLTMSAQTGVATETLQEWTYASQFMDTSVETMTKSMARMTREVGNAANGNEKAQEKFKKLGVSIYDSSGNLRSAEDIFMDSIDALGKIGNETERDALAMEIFGKSAQELNPLIQTGSAGMKSLADEANAMGVVFSGDALAAMGSFDDSMQRFNQTGVALKNTIGLTLIPAFQPLIDTATSAMSKIAIAMQDGIQPGELEGIFNTIFETLNSTLANLTTVVSGAMPYIIEGVNQLVGSLVAFLPGLLETITPAAMQLLQGLMTAISTNIDPIMTAATTLITSLVDFLVQNLPLLIQLGSDIVLKLVGYISDNAASIVTGATTIITSLIDGITALLPDLIPLGIDMMVKLALALVEAIPSLVAKLPEIVAAIIEGLKAVDWMTLGNDMLTGLYNGLKAALGSLLESIKSIFTSIWDGIKSVFGINSPSTVAAEAGGFILQGLLDGFRSAVDAVVTAVKEIFGKIWDAIKSIFGFGKGESEESKEAKESGKNIMTGMKDGINDNKGAVETVVKNVSSDILKRFRTELGTPENGNGGSTKTKPYGKSIAKGIADGISEAGKASTYSGGANSVRDAIGSAFGSAFGIAGTGFLGTGTQASSKFKGIGTAVAEGIANGIRDGAEKIKSAAVEAANAALAAAKAELGIQSPSKKAYSQIGLPFIQGIAAALSDGTRSLQEGVGSAVAGMSEVGVRPLKLDTSGMNDRITPVRAELVLDGRSFGALVVDIADRGQGFNAANLKRLQMGVSV